MLNLLNLLVLPSCSMVLRARLLQVILAQAQAFKRHSTLAHFKELNIEIIEFETSLVLL